MEFLNPYYLQLTVFALTNTILALSVFFALATGQMTLGTAGFMSIGAYTSAILHMNFDVPMFLSILIGGIVVALIAVLIGLPTTKLSGLYLTIVTVGFSEVIRVFFLNWDYVNGALGINGIPALGQGITNNLAASGFLEKTGLDYIQLQYLVQIVIVLAVVILIIWAWKRLERSKVGRAFAAVRTDLPAAELQGINVAHVRMVSFVLSAFVAGIGGGFYAHTYSTILPDDFSFSQSVDNLLYTIFGGSQVVWGPVFGSITLTLLPEFLRGLAEYRDTIYGLLLLLMMIFRPQGLLTPELMRRMSGSKQPKRLQEKEDTE